MSEKEVGHYYFCDNFHKSKPIFTIFHFTFKKVANFFSETRGTDFCIYIRFDSMIWEILGKYLWFCNTM